MNKHLLNFFVDEIKDNSYYENIREYGKVNNLELKELALKIANQYFNFIDDFGPYRFMDGIENYLTNEFETEKTKDIDDILEKAMINGYFEN